MGNLTGKTEKSGTVGASDKAGNVDTICILLGDVDPTAEKLYRSDPNVSYAILESAISDCHTKTLIFVLTEKNIALMSG